MHRLYLAVVILLLVCVGCGTTDPHKVPWRVLPNVDFDYDSTWNAGMGAVQVHFPYLEHCNKDDMKIVSYHRLETDVNLTSPYQYAKRAFLVIRPRESTEGTTYDIEVHVGKYWRPRNLLKDLNEDWDLIGWDPELEEKIIREFQNQTRQDQRVRQAHKNFKKHRGRGW